MVNVFFADLDNTLIYSHRKSIGNGKTVVEYLDGKQQSYMTDYTYNYLKAADWLDIVPVTTRTYTQFQRLTCIEELFGKKAVVCNGGMLLIGGKEDEEWSEETIRLAGDQLDTLNTVAELLRSIAPKMTIHRPTPYMIYMKSERLKDTCGDLRQMVHTDQITIQNDSRKVYLFAASVNKGNAILRLRKRFAIGNDVAAGDNMMDVSMLNLAGYAFVSEKIASMVRNENKVVINGEIISDKICDELDKLHIAGKL